MPKQPIEHDEAICAIPGHAENVPSEAEVPIGHFKKSANDAFVLIEFLELSLRREEAYLRAYEEHKAGLYRMVLLALCASFERFLKELASVCVDHVAARVLDDRLDKLEVKATALSAHFGSGTLGKAMCEGSTWMDCKVINDRFRKLLADPFYDGAFYLFPTPGTNQTPKEGHWRYRTMNTLWQLRHTLAHNEGLITRSDALKFSLLIRRKVSSPMVLRPSRTDLGNVIEFLYETAQVINDRVGERLAELLTKLYEDDNSLFDPAEEARALAEELDKAVVIAGCEGTPPQPFVYLKGTSGQVCGGKGALRVSTSTVLP